MARRLIGLDIGTNAVTVAEVRAGEPPRLDMFGQVALGRETMREGEVADDAAVTEAVGRLREEVGLKKAAGAPRAREPARRRAPDRDAADVARGARERAAVPGRGAHPDPARRRGARLRDPRARRARATAASRACRCCSPRCRKRRCCGSSPRSKPVACRSPRSISFRSRSSVRSRARPRARARRAPVARNDLDDGAEAASGHGRQQCPAPKASSRSVAASPRSRCTRSACRASYACSAPAAASSPTRSRTSSTCRPKPRRR